MYLTQFTVVLVLMAGFSRSQQSIGALTDAEKQLVRDIFADVDKNLLQNGMNILLGMFDECPLTRVPFSRYKEVDTKAMADHPMFQAQVLRIMTSLNLIVRLLDEPSIQDSFIQLLAEGHRGRTVPQHFISLQKHYVQYVNETLGSDYTAEQDAVLKKFFSSFVGRISQLLEANA